MENSSFKWTSFREARQLQKWWLRHRSFVKLFELKNINTLGLRLAANFQHRGCNFKLNILLGEELCRAQ